MPLDVPICPFSSEKVTSKCAENYNIEKITYLQRKIKSFLAKKKNRKFTPATSKKSTKSKVGKGNPQQDKLKQNDLKNQNNNNKSANNDVSYLKKNSHYI